MLAAKRKANPLRALARATGLAACLLGASAMAQGFKFSNPPEGEAAAKAAEAEQAQTVQRQLSAPCRDKIKNQKIMVLLAEERASYAGSDVIGMALTLIEARADAVLA